MFSKFLPERQSWHDIHAWAWEDNYRSDFKISLSLFFVRFISYMWVHCRCLQTHLKRALDPHYRWLWATMWWLGIELRTSGRTVSALYHWAISPAQDSVSLNKQKVIHNFYFYFCPLYPIELCSFSMCNLLYTYIKLTVLSRAWWRTPLIPALGRQRQADFWVRGLPGLQSESQDSQSYSAEPGVVAHAFNPSTWEAEAGRFLSSRPAWSTKWVPGQPELHRETLSWKTKKKKKATS